jgi:hypothetical protein
MLIIIIFPSPLVVVVVNACEFKYADEASASVSLICSKMQAADNILVDDAEWPLLQSCYFTGV